ncbi:MAG: prephenate dehydratase [Spirochaetes bacterium]|nr:prephenate dehydratase [Spirochaetota bacterium]
MNDKIAQIDKQIIKLIEERSALLLDAFKKSTSEEVASAALNHVEIERMVKEFYRGAIPQEHIVKLLIELQAQAVLLCRPLNVAYLGPAGTFTHSALLEIFADAVNAIAQKTIPDVFDEVERGAADFGVVPVENSTEGAVTYTLDELLDTDLMIVSEKFLRITHNLVGICDDLKKIKKLYSHPQALGQCKTWLRNHLPNVEIIQVNSTSKAAETASWDKFSAAIASDVAAEIYKLRVLVKGIEDSRNNFTRFLVIGKKDNPPTGNDKTSIVCSVKDRPGALYEMLKPFHDAGINMTKIESRPDKKKMWAYNFFIDFIGHREDEVVKTALEKMQECTIFLKVLGSYPVSHYEL